MAESEILSEIYEDALSDYQSGNVSYALPQSLVADCDVIIENQERNKGALAVIVTLLVKKIASPEQDVRMHQAGMPGGFSGRGLDTDVVTPFLREQNFPYMGSGTGWLTRSLEQPAPYDLDYPGRITPSVVKDAFLSIIHDVQARQASARHILGYILIGLIEFRERNTNIALAKPVNLSVSETVNLIRRHHSVQAQGAARLPVLAIHAILRVLRGEVDRYVGYEVAPLESHTAADSRTDLIGDVHIVDSNGVLYEGYEVKHNIPITSGLIETSFEKLKTTSVERFYILTTHERDDYSEFDPDIRRVADTHGCQLIVNGVDRTLMYYLRLIRQTRDFIREYVSGLETDLAVSFELKAAWNQIVENQDN